MIIVCPSCKTRYQISDREVDCQSFIAHCKRCKKIFTAYLPVKIEEIKFRDIEKAKRGRPQSNIIAVSNQKGGVAKTSTCLNLGLSLSRLRKKILLLDFDVQANLTLSLGYKETHSFYDVLTGIDPFDHYIVATKYPNLFLFPSNKDMVLLNKIYFGANNFEFILKDSIMSIKSQFDFIIIDTPPSIEFFTINALTVASTVIIPSQCDYLSTHGIDQILKLITLVKSRTNPFIHPRILITMFEKSNATSEMIEAKLKKAYPEILFETIVEKDSLIMESQIMSMPVLEYNAQSKAGKQYNNVALEILRPTLSS